MLKKKFLFYFLVWISIFLLQILYKVLFLLLWKILILFNKIKLTTINKLLERYNMFLKSRMTFFNLFF